MQPTAEQFTEQAWAASMAAQACSVNCSAVGCISNAFQTGFTVWGLFLLQWGQTEAYGSVLTQGAANRSLFLEFAEPLDANA